jgi:hypothetical protein
MPKMVTPIICLLLNDAFGVGVGIRVGLGVEDGVLVGSGVIVGVGVSGGMGVGVGERVIKAERFNTRLSPISQVPVSIAE